MKYQCPICGTHAAKLFLRRDNVPIHQNFLFEEENQAINIARGALSIAICHNCGFVFNADFDASLMLYTEKYENTQSYSSVFDKYLDDSIDYLVNKKGVKNCRVIEVGCGKGHFLRKLVELGENSGIGFDPSYIGPLETSSGKLCFKRKFYDASSADLVADIIICRHVIEHIANPLNMLGTIRQALANSPHAQVFFETPDVEWIFKNQVVWDFFYEHCSYFSTPSIRLAFEKSGFFVDDIKLFFGNQYFWVEARPTSKPSILALKN
ncbi:MAG: class I SAM-dependent methyltransferase, partial [Anaerolineaceae bacterium]|nr:class I SAM-dependent methyltransferase [Anaerolineaceae bacterium]